MIELENRNGRRWRARFILFPVFLNDTGPVLIRLAKVSLLVFVELVLDAKIVLHQQASVDDLPCFDFDRGGVALAGSVGAIAAELRFVLPGFFVKSRLVLGRRKIVFGSVILGLELRTPLYCPIVREKCNRVIALNSYSVSIQIVEFFCGGDSRYGSQQYGGNKQLLHLGMASLSS